MNRRFSFGLIWLLMVSTIMSLMTVGLRLNLDIRYMAQTGGDVNGYIQPSQIVAGGLGVFTFTSDSSLTFVDFSSNGVNKAGCVFDQNSAKCSGNPMGDGKKCWWRWSCPVVSTVGSYNGTFTNREGKNQTVSFTVNNGVSGINYYVSSQSVLTGERIAFTFTADTGYTKVLFQSDGGINGCSLDLANSAKCSGNPMGDGKKCWWRWNCVAGAPGTYVASFSNAESMSQSLTYVIGGFSTPTSVLPTPTRIPTLTPTKTPTVTPIRREVSFRITYGGLLAGAKCGMNWMVKVGLLQGDSPIDFVDVIPEKLSEGNYRVTVGYADLKKTSQVAVFVKGPKHLQTKYGVDGQLDYYSKAGGELTLVSGKIFDFTNYPLLAGDINQDGAINGYDFSEVKAKALIHEGVSEGSNLPSDLDGNCQVNANDVSILKLSLADKQSQLY